MHVFHLKTNNNKQFIFRFSLQNNDEINCKFGARYLSLELVRNDIPSPNLSFFWEGCLSTEPVLFDLRFGDNIDIRGTIKLFSVNGEKNDYVFLDAHYGYQIENCFEGNIIEISKK